MPYKTLYGTHYHMTYRCHGADIPCNGGSQSGLEPCADCCNASNQAMPGSCTGSTSGSSATATGEGSEFAAVEDSLRIRDIDWDILETAPVPQELNSEFRERFLDIVPQTMKTKISGNSSPQPREMDAEFMKRFAVVMQQTTQLMNDYGFTDTDRFMNEANDTLLASWLGPFVGNHSKHGDDAILYDQMGNMCPLESKVSSVYETRAETENHEKPRVPSATFNDTTEDKIEAFRQVPSYVGLGVRRNMGDFEFIVVVPSNKIADAIDELHQKQVKAERRSHQTFEMGRLLNLSEGEGRIVIEDESHRETVEQYLRDLGGNYPKYAKYIVTKDEWRRDNGFASQGVSESLECSRRITAAIEEEGRKAVRATYRDGAARPLYLPRPKTIDEHFRKRYQIIRNSINELMESYGYHDADRFLNEVSDLRLTAQMFSGMPGASVAAYHDKNNPFDTMVLVERNGHKQLAFEIESKVCSGIATQVEAELTDDAYKKWKQKGRPQRSPSKARGAQDRSGAYYKWGALSATFNDVKQEKIDAYAHNPRGIVSVGLRTEMMDCRCAICVPSSQVAVELQQQYDTRQAKYEKKKKEYQELQAAYASYEQRKAAAEVAGQKAPDKPEKPKKPQKPRETFRINAEKLMQMSEGYVVAFDSVDATRRALKRRLPQKTYNQIKNKIITQDEYQRLLVQEHALYD